MRGYEYPLTHDISTLLEFLESIGHDIKRYWDLVEFNTFAVRFRYETFDYLEESLNREVVIEKVEELIRHVDKQIDSE